MRSNSRAARALARQQKMLEQQDHSWKIWKSCEVCGALFCVNCPWEDRKPRTPRFKGMVVCFNCDPRSTDPHYPYMSDQISRTRRGRFRYKVAMALVLVKAMAQRPCERGSDCGKCIPCASRKVEGIC